MQSNQFNNYIPESENPDCYKSVLIPNRVFVGGLPSYTRENELRHFFQSFGYVKDVKIVKNKSYSKRNYGFVTFDNAQIVKELVEKDSKEKVFFKSRHLNISHAFMKIKDKTELTDDQFTDNSLISNGEYSLYDGSAPILYVTSHENSFFVPQMTHQRGFYSGVNSSPMSTIPRLVNKATNNYSCQEQNSMSSSSGGLNDSYQSSLMSTPPSPNQPPNWRLSIPFSMAPMMTPLIGSSPPSLPMIPPMQCPEMICIYGAPYPVACEYYQNPEAIATLGQAAVVNNAPLPIEQ